MRFALASTATTVLLVVFDNFTSWSRSSIVENFAQAANLSNLGNGRDFPSHTKHCRYAQSMARRRLILRCSSRIILRDDLLKKKNVYFQALPKLALPSSPQFRQLFGRSFLSSYRMNHTVSLFRTPGEEMVPPTTLFCSSCANSES